MEGKNNSPNWIPHLVSALLTVGATWAAIRGEVASQVQQEVQLEMANQRETITEDVRHLLAGFTIRVDTMLEHRIAEQADRVIERIGLIPVARPDGTRVYQPNVVIRPDTAALHAILAKLDSIGPVVDDTRRRVWELEREERIPKGKRRTYRIVDE